MICQKNFIIHPRFCQGFEGFRQNGSTRFFGHSTKLPENRRLLTPRKGPCNSFSAVCNSFGKKNCYTAFATFSPMSPFLLFVRGPRSGTRAKRLSRQAIQGIEINASFAGGRFLPQWRPNGHGAERSSRLCPSGIGQNFLWPWRLR